MSTAIKAPHTPGPWLTILDQEENKFKIFGPLNEYIAEIKPTPGCDGNAHLVATAPELLNAAETFIEWVDDVWGSAAMNIATEAAYRKAKAAIRKARGGV